MNKTEVEQYKQKLIVLKEKVAGVLENITRDNLNSEMRDISGDLSGYSMHMADVGTENFDREVSLNIAGHENEIVHQIDMAIERIDEKKFGLCEMCSEYISSKRLDAIPYALNCIKCESELEKERS
ncbi:MAG: TraR/DksA C4-type zinc finger protein [Candidatus Aureabacteria bacterium]|nr:TraR/DksA C4-type zinc finger protein [Candidatus Auribacterota bacterium]